MGDLLGLGLVFAGKGGGGAWVRHAHGKLSDVDVAATFGAVVMFGLSFAPSYVYVNPPGSGDITCTFPDQAENLQCELSNWKLAWSSPTGINAWHETSTMLPVILAMAVGLLVALRATFPLLLPATLIRMITRVMLLLAGWIIGWAVFSPDEAIFNTMRYGWGLWASWACLGVMSLIAMPSPPRFVAWLVN